MGVCFFPDRTPKGSSGWSYGFHIYVSIELVAEQKASLSCRWLTDGLAGVGMGQVVELMVEVLIDLVEKAVLSQQTAYFVYSICPCYRWHRVVVFPCCRVRDL